MRHAVVVAAAILFAGCGQAPDPFAESEIVSAFGDAQVRVANATTGEHKFSQIVRVPVGTNTLTVKAFYRTEDDASFVLKNPQGNGARFDTFADARQLQNDEWFRGRDPPPGSWYLTGHLAQGGAYAFGVYFG